jgi:hypothetical protein
MIDFRDTVKVGWPKTGADSSGFFCSNSSAEPNSNAAPLTDRCFSGGGRDADRLGSQRQFRDPRRHKHCDEKQ